MKNSIGICALLSLLVLPALAPTPVEAQDASWLMGSWEIERETQRGTTTMTLTFAEEADSIVGTMSMSMGERGIAFSLAEVRLEGMKVSFKMGPPAGGAGAQRGGARAGGGSGGAGGRAGGAGRGGAGVAAGGGPLEQTFSGELKGEVIQGTITTPRGDQPFTARRPSGESSGR